MSGIGIRGDDYFVSAIGEETEVEGRRRRRSRVNGDGETMNGLSADEVTGAGMKDRV